MSMRIQSQTQAAYVATQQALAPLTGKKAEAVKTADEPQKAAGGLNAPAYTVEIIDAAREKYAAEQRGAAAEEPQDGSTNAAQQTLTAANGANAAETAPTAANTANDAQRQIDSAEEVAAPNEERGDKPNSPLDARLRKLRQKLADAKRAAVPDDEKKARIAEIKRQIQTLEGQIAAQQSHGA
ncbi:hypothetical protein [uncultured Selenomonas sp.]|uniref:hypothetical protein n=1 Tax=uncultured Selenomonas sp. TaxID=159275 RepID=UPI0028D1351B|nr:hypothetical protein [uncultured Selenomonas sp.]